jgi:Fe-S cluster assembly ATP-binding protein
MALLEIRDVVMRLGETPVLNHLTMEFWAGHVHALVGPNGAGKSTLANTIMGLFGYTAFEGDIVYDGESLKGVPVDERARRGITLAWQEPARFQGLPVHKYIRAGAKDPSDDRVDQALLKVGLDPRTYRDRACDRTLSGGERKRVEIAALLAMEPRVVLMDEPDSGIDIQAINHIFDAIQFFKQNGATVILITHSLPVLQQAEHAFLLCNGRLRDKGPISKIENYFAENCIMCATPNEPEKRQGAWQ